MLTRRDRVIFLFLITFNLLLWLFFGILFFRFHNVFMQSVPEFRSMTEQERAWALQGVDDPYQALISSVIIVRFTAWIINFGGFYNLLYYKRDEQHIFPIRRKWKIIIPWATIISYIPCYYYIAYRADYFRVWMHLVPQMFLSAAFLTFTAIGFYSLLNQRDHEEWLRHKPLKPHER